jgi:Calcineurin-like phosphoesterase
MLAALGGGACGDDDGDRLGGPQPSPVPGTGGTASPPAPAPRPPSDAGVDADDAQAAIFECPETPTAYVFDHLDPWTMSVGGAADLLARAGFNVQPLPLDRDPRYLRGLIFISSFASESPQFREYVARNAIGLYTFVDAANVLVQMTQADQTEAMPAFLPNSQSAHRTDADVSIVRVLDREHPLLTDVPIAEDGALTWRTGRVGWETFDDQTGFAILLAGEANGRNAVLMEGAYSQGRFILSAIAADKPEGAGPDRDRFNQAFFHNLLGYVRNVCQRQPAPVKITPSPARPTFTPGAAMLAVLPDTQYYAINFPGVYNAQTSWIATNARARNIGYVLHLGDIVDQNSPREWQRASSAMGLLDGVVPYALVPGNHDIGPGGIATTRDTLLNQFFSYDKTATWPTFGGAFEPGKLENTYHLFELGGRPYIVIALEWGPRNEVLAWADSVMAAHPDRFGIMITHAYLNNNDWRYDMTDMAHPQDFNPHAYGTAGGVNDGEQIWQKLIRRHQFVMTFNGHVLGDGTGYLASVTDKGNTCHQMLSNYQFRNLGGEGFLRLVEFLPDDQTVRVYSYSPLFDSYLSEPDQSFSFRLDVPLRPAN